MFNQTSNGIKTCSIHKLDYEEMVSKLAGREFLSLCPECTKEQSERDAVEAKLRLEKQFQEQRRQSKENQINRLLSGSLIPPRYLTRTFANYRADSEGQQRALKAIESYAEDFTTHEKSGAGIVMAGKPGTGKTHLACALANDLIFRLQKNPVFIPASKMIRKIRETYRRDSEHTEQQMINLFRDADLLIIDEVGIQRGTEAEEHLLFEIINERNAYFNPTILISNLNAADIKTYIGERAMDRMREGGGKFVSFDWDSYRGNVAKDTDLPIRDKRES
ncbi:ATP-binding protein [uncultured Amphritea sp.]|uniref:ATP-binding protein n=1 Tax=uncultured Amphritea sp. TaxID=981605 RepID=UPI00261D3582|nr:ATP-binding protein [uncultured Amphritea sp.]